MIVEKIYCDLYATEFIFVISKAKKVNLEEIKIDWNRYAGCCSHKGKIYIAVHPNASLDALVHECDHAVSKLWKKLGIKKKRGADECYSYMLGWLFNKCHKIWKTRKKN